MRTLALLLLVAACSKDDGGGPAPSTGSAVPAGSAAKKGTGFSASLSAELAKEGSAAPSVSLTESAAGSAAATGTGSAAAKGSASGSASAPVVAMAGSAGSAAAKGSAAPVTAPPATTTTTTTTPPATTTTTTTTPATTAPAKPTARVPVKPPPELAAIKMDLEPNWERDIGEAGTISFVLNVPSSSDTRLFVFHYGYDPAGAPNDRDAYMAWLADQKLLTVSLNRQRGAAWYLEGTDGSGAPAFRTLVNYGGKHLVCWGTLYKDAASNSLGDLRDKVVMTAKQICGTMTL